MAKKKEEDIKKKFSNKEIAILVMLYMLSYLLYLSLYMY